MENQNNQPAVTQKRNAWRYNISPGMMLFIARRIMKVPRDKLATQMGIDLKLLTRIERGRMRMPNTVLLKIFMFGIDFWGDRMTLEIQPENPNKLR